jgi:hypothetical protein
MLALSAMNVITGQQSLGLVPHPRTPCTSVTAIRAAAAVKRGGDLSLEFVLQGDLSAVPIPEPRPSRHMDGLWRHTCLEAFVMADVGPGYREFNFAPSGEWAAYAFRGYREGRVPIAEAAPVVDVRRGEDRLWLEVEIRADCLPKGRRLRLGLSAVVESADGALSCWALRHPAEQPDFHHVDTFALKLETCASAEAENRAAGVGP